MRGHRPKIAYPFFQCFADGLDLDPPNDRDRRGGILADVSGEIRHDPSSPMFYPCRPFGPPVIQTRRERPLFRPTQIRVMTIGAAARCLRGKGWGAGWDPGSPAALFY